MVQQFLSIYSTPGLNNSSHTASCGTPAVHSHHPVAQGAAEQGAAGPGSTPSQGTCIIPNGALKKKEAVGYVSREITTEDVLDATLESCQSYNPQQQGVFFVWLGQCLFGCHCLAPVGKQAAVCM